MWSFVHAFAGFLFPRYCVVCGRRLVTGEEYLCSGCLLEMPTVRCKSYFDNDMAQKFWGLVPMEKATAIFYYRHGSPYTRLLFEMKYHDNISVCRALGRFMAAKLESKGFFDGINVIVPVPLAAERYKQRGYNQSEELARGIASITGLRVETRSVRRVVSNPSQTVMRPEERMDNVRGIFEVTDAAALSGCHVLLVDDVMTTGATLLSCAETIFASCSIRLSVLTLAMAGRELL